MKRRDLVKAIASAAKTADVSWELLRDTGNHTSFLLAGQVRIDVPRHTEVGEMLAEKIMKDCEPVLGKRWWR